VKYPGYPVATGKRPVVTIDGPAGAGKSTLAKALAKALGFTYLESGALYRAVALKVLEEGLSLDDQTGIASVAERAEVELSQRDGETRVFLDGREVTERLRREEVGETASTISKLAPVREKLNQLQQRLGAEGGVVVEGRDAGTVVFPRAEYKFFLTASLEERARRRLIQLDHKGMEADFAQILEQMSIRDARDQGRDLAPLKPAPGAMIIDSTDLKREDVLERMLAEVGGKA
jgi:cytidylate kinase